MNKAAKTRAITRHANEKARCLALIEEWQKRRDSSEGERREVYAEVVRELRLAVHLDRLEKS